MERWQICSNLLAISNFINEKVFEKNNRNKITLSNYIIFVSCALGRYSEAEFSEQVYLLNWSRFKLIIGP